MPRNALLILALLVGACTDVPLDAQLEVPCDTSGPAGVASCLEPARIREDIEAYSGEGRGYGGTLWQATQDLCFERMRELGFETRLQFEPVGGGVNVIGRRLGEIYPDEEVVLSAHYDSRFEWCHGADDNMSGVAGVLESARLLVRGRYARTLVVACWDREESLDHGAQAYVDEVIAESRSVKMSYVYEMIAYTDTEPGSQQLGGLEVAFPEQGNILKAWRYRGDFLAVVFNGSAREHAERLVDLAPGAGVPAIGLGIADEDTEDEMYKTLRRSDHKHFWSAGMPAAMVTDTGPLRNPNYHCYQDNADDTSTLDYDYAAAVTRATTMAMVHSLEPLSPP